MRVFFNTVLLILASLLIALVGSWANYKFLQTADHKDLIKEAESNYEDFLLKFNPDRKTIVVIGRSTSIYSFNKGKTILNKYSFADKLEENNNVLKLSSVDLLNYDEVKLLLNFAASKIPRPDLVVVENLTFFQNSEVFDGSNYLILNSYCMTKDAPAELCKNFLSMYQNISDNLLFTNPCIRKYSDKKSIAYLLYPKERSEFIREVLLCGKSTNSLDEIKPFIINTFQEGYAMELPDEETADIGITRSALPYSEVQLLFINKNMIDVMTTFDFKKVLIMPMPAKDPVELDKLPVFKKFPERLLYLDFSQNIFHNKKTFNKNFLDGSHPSAEIQDFEAARIQSYLNSK